MMLLLELRSFLSFLFLCFMFLCHFAAFSSLLNNVMAASGAGAATVFATEPPLGRQDAHAGQYTRHGSVRFLTVFATNPLWARHDAAWSAHGA